MIKLIKRAAFFIWMLLMLILGFWLGHENDQLVSVMLMGIALPQLSLGTYLVFMLWAGIGVGFVASFFLTQGRLFVNNRALKKAKKEVAQLKGGG